MTKQIFIGLFVCASLTTFAQEKKKLELKQKGTFAGKKSDTPDANVGAKLPDFQIINTSKDLVSSSELIKEGKPFVVMFFNPSCSHCQVSTKMFNDSLAKYSDIPFILVTGDNMANDIRTFADMTGTKEASHITIGADYSKISELLFEYKGIPQLMFYDKNKILRSKLYSDFHAADVANELDKLLAN
jgi:thiol-disulfide isomerase/thioredoxin